jgi:hypothetical protein
MKWGGALQRRLEKGFEAGNILHFFGEKTSSCGTVSACRTVSDVYWTCFYMRFLVQVLGSPSCCRTEARAVEAGGARAVEAGGARAVEAGGARAPPSAAVMFCGGKERERIC